MAGTTTNTRSSSAGTGDALKTVILRGELGKRYGHRHRFAISTPAEAIRALTVNYKDFQNYMATSAERGVGYKVIVGKTQVENLDDIHIPLGRAEAITIVPVIGGAKNGGLGGVLLGAALIGASFFLPTAPLLGSMSSISLASISFNTGLSLALGGMSQMLSSAPKTSAPAERPENKPSYFFNGPVNTVAQGQPVPVGYGRMIIGGAVLSLGIDTDEIEG